MPPRHRAVERRTCPRALGPHRLGRCRSWLPALGPLLRRPRLRPALSHVLVRRARPVRAARLSSRGTASKPRFARTWSTCSKSAYVRCTSCSVVAMRTEWNPGTRSGQKAMGPTGAPMPATWASGADCSFGRSEAEAWWYRSLAQTGAWGLSAGRHKSPDTGWTLRRALWPGRLRPEPSVTRRFLLKLRHFSATHNRAFGAPWLAAPYDQPKAMAASSQRRCSGVSGTSSPRALLTAAQASRACTPWSMSTAAATVDDRPIPIRQWTTA